MGDNLVDMSGRSNMKVTYPYSEDKKQFHNYMVSYIYGNYKFGSLVLTEEVDTLTSDAQQLADFHAYLTKEISDYQKEQITILNIVRFN